MDNSVVINYYEFDKTSQILLQKDGHTSIINMDTDIELLSTNAVSLALQNGIDTIYVINSPMAFQSEFVSNVEQSQKLLHNFNNIDVRFV